jgi:large subunit ribosomal protein L21
MYAIVEIAGKQYRVQPNEKVYVPLLSQEVGGTVTFDKVLMHFDTATKLGTPYLPNAKVTASVIGHGKEDTVIVFKKKRRKGYRIRNGHRQQFTEIQIQNISL